MLVAGLMTLVEQRYKEGRVYILQNMCTGKCKCVDMRVGMCGCIDISVRMRADMCA